MSMALTENMEITQTTQINEIDGASLEAHFQKYRAHIIGEGAHFDSVHGRQQLHYADWIASGRLFGPIETILRDKIGPMVANTHSFSSETGKVTTYAYRHARQIIKKHVNAGPSDILVTAGTGMTGVLSRLQRIMGLRRPDASNIREQLAETERPVVLLTHMEHHSHQVPWMETIADVVIVPPDEEGKVSAHMLEESLREYKDRRWKIGAFTACSNVTGMITPYHELAKVMHRHGGVCLVDFAASAPYVAIDMHPRDPDARLDAVYFSPHKFLGGPGSCGVLVFHKELYSTVCPDVPGGGNVKWTDPWGGYGYHDDIETKEDGGTPGFLQVIRAALAIKLKEKMGVREMEKREAEQLAICHDGLLEVPGLRILGDREAKKIGCVSFTVEGIHYNLIVRLLNDYFGIQVRGGWSCASTYAHYLFGLDRQASKKVVDGIEQGNLTDKPGWVRLSLHPTVTDEEVRHYCRAIKTVVAHIEEWGKDYTYNPKTNEFDHEHGDRAMQQHVASWFQ